MGKPFSAVFLVVSFMMVVTSCAHHSNQQLLIRTQKHMGTLVEVRVPESQKYISEDVFQKFSQLDQLLSSYKPDSEISRLNAGEKFKVHQLTAEILLLAEKMKKLTSGNFDHTLGRVSGQLDLGGIGKGFAVDKAREILQLSRVTRGLIAASGDIFCLHACLVAVRNPFSESQEFLGKGRLNSKAWAITTSGRDQRKHKSEVVHHLVSPKTGLSPNHWMSLTIISQTHSNTELDAWATALFVMTPEKAIKALKRQPWQFLVVTAKKKILLSENWRAQFEDWKFGSHKNDKNIMTVQVIKKN